MAALETIYADVGRLARLAQEAVEANYASDADLGTQAERLEQITELASRNAPLLRKIDKALGG